jgi:hypothetical protein
LPRAIEDYRRL